VVYRSQWGRREIVRDVMGKMDLKKRKGLFQHMARDVEALCAIVSVICVL
jgi:hypothetical protein